MWVERKPQIEATHYSQCRKIDNRGKKIENPRGKKILKNEGQDEDSAKQNWH